MKIAIDASCLAINRFSGLSEVVHNMLLYLPTASDNIFFTMFMNYFRANGHTGPISYEGIASHSLRLPRRVVDQWWKYDWMPFDLYLRGIDVFHSFHIKVPPTKKMKTILTVHDCRYLALPELYRPQEVADYRHEMEKSLDRVDRVAVVSEFTRQEISSYFRFSKDRIKVIQNGFRPYRPRKSSEAYPRSSASLSLSGVPGGCPEKEANYFPKAPLDPVLTHGAYGKQIGDEEKVERFIERNSLPKSYLLYAGTLDPRKNLGRLIEATELCRNNSHTFPDLVIIGVTREEFFKSKHGNTARELGILDHIHLGGVVEKAVLWGLIKRATCLCYPSLYEGFGFPPLEAMSVGTPVLAGNKSSIPEITGNAACLVDPESVEDIAQGLNRIVTDSDYCRLLIESGYRQVAQFSWERAAAEYVSLYEEVINS